MDMSMIEALLKSHHPICVAIRRRISLQESPGGRSLSSSQDGQKTDQSGQPPFRANLSPQQESKQEPTTSDTSGQSFNALSASADLQLSLASRLQARLHGKNGSPEYVWTCKQWAIPSQPSIFALRARGRKEKDGLCVGIRRLGNPLSSEHLTSDSGCTGSHIVGWPSPSAQGSAGEISKDLVRVGNKWLNSKTGRMLQTNLATDARQLVGWPTPAARDVKGESGAGRQEIKGHPADTLANAAAITGWRSPATTEPGVSVDRLVTKDGEPWTPGQRAYDKITGRLAQVGLTHEAQASMPIVGWMTPTTTNMTRTEEGMEKRIAYRDSIGRQYVPGNLGEQASVVAGWATPGARDHKDTPGMSETGVNPDGSIRNRLDQLGRQVGLTSTSSPAATAKPGVLNPALSRWLQGYPVEWCQAAIRASRAMPTKRRKQG